jgi:hypothetical protein
VRSSAINHSRRISYAALSLPDAEERFPSGAQTLAEFMLANPLTTLEHYRHPHTHAAAE